MKIKISEGQANRLNLLKEELNPLTKFEYYCKVKTEELNKLYAKVSNIIIIEVLNGEVNIKEIVGMVDEIETSLYKGNTAAYKYIEQLPDSNLDIRIDDAQYNIDQKINSIQLILDSLERLRDSVDELKITQPFDDVKPLDVTGTENNQ